MDLEADIARFLLLDLQVRLDRVIEGVGKDHAQIQRLDVVFIQIDHVVTGGDAAALGLVELLVEDGVHRRDAADAHVGGFVDHAAHFLEIIFQLVIFFLLRQHIH